MSDPHLNLFYSYNRDQELIENNLTRAFIATLRLISVRASIHLLRRLLEPPGRRQLHSPDFSLPELIHPEFALQDHLNRNFTKNAMFQYVVAIASDRYMEEEEGRKRAAFQAKTYRGSIPDGWILDNTTSVCILVESKVGNNPQSSDQIFSHAKDWFGFSHDEATNHLLSISWDDVIDEVYDLRFEQNEIFLNPQETILLGELEEYIGYFGYRRITGISINHIPLKPGFELKRQQRFPKTRTLFSAPILKSPPSFSISLSRS